MGVPFEDDDDRRAQLEELGGQFLVGAATVYGILEEDYEPADMGSGHALSGHLFRLTVCTADVTGVDVGTEVDELEYDEREFVVAFPPQRTGVGRTQLILHLR